MSAERRNLEGNGWLSLAATSELRIKGGKNGRPKLGRARERKGARDDFAVGKKKKKGESLILRESCERSLVGEARGEGTRKPEPRAVAFLPLVPWGWSRECRSGKKKTKEKEKTPKQKKTPTQKGKGEKKGPLPCEGRGGKLFSWRKKGEGKVVFSKVKKESRRRGRAVQSEGKKKEKTLRRKGGRPQRV